LGINSRCLIEKCHFSECRNNAIYLVNPCSALIRHNTISRSVNGIMVDMLSSSHWVDKVRMLEISDNDIQMTTNNGI
jgi:hypothetical protein